MFHCDSDSEIPINYAECFINGSASKELALRKVRSDPSFSRQGKSKRALFEPITPVKEKDTYWRVWPIADRGGLFS